eukprot:GHVS01037617.1.p1 GENE.GHVS01037617.1~~GHVS01037617.1.p1  ORF type:complete len:371 (+),score=40.73 GHVS01037617.1:125-1114(+)
MDEVSGVLNEMKQISGKLRKLVNLCQKETPSMKSVDFLKKELTTGSESLVEDSSIVKTDSSYSSVEMENGSSLSGQSNNSPEPLASHLNLSACFPLSSSTICGGAKVQPPFECGCELTEGDKADGGESLCQRYKLIQTTVLPLLVLRLRQLNRYMCMAVKNCGEVVENDSEALGQKKQKLTNQLYQLAWLRRTGAAEESYQTKTWDQVRSESTTEEAYTSKCSSQPGFVSKQEDDHTFTLNLLRFEMEGRLHGRAQVDAVRTNRSNAEQRLVTLLKQEADIQKSLGRLADSVREIHTVCQQEEPSCAEDLLIDSDYRTSTALESTGVNS